MAAALIPPRSAVSTRRIVVAGPSRLWSVRRMNLALIHEAIAGAFPERECVITPTRRLTYAQVCERMRRLANVLHAHALGCRRERADLANHESGQDHLGIYMLNCPEYLETM